MRSKFLLWQRVKGIEKTSKKRYASHSSFAATLFVSYPNSVIQFVVDTVLSVAT